MLKVAVGHSNDPDSQLAIDEVLEQCIRSLAGEIPKAGLLFAAIDFDHALILQRIHQAFPGIELIGGTTDGEISSVLEFQQDSLTLMLFCSDDIEIKAGIGREVSKNPVEATRLAVEQAKGNSTTKTQLCVTVPEGFTASGVLILDGLRQALELSVPIIGGLAADQWRFQKTYQFFRKEVLSDAVPILLFSGKLLFSHGLASGWHPIGKKSRVTKVNKNIVYEIDGKPALDFYRYYFGDLPPSSEYPLAVFDRQEKHFYLRAANVFDQESGSITFFADIAEQAVVQIAQTTREDILAASQASIKNALESYPGSEPEAVIFFSCASRRRILGTQTKQEYQIAKNCLTRAVPSCGFYSSGELAPLERKGQTEFHNKAFVTLLLGTK
jgi:hypothetical protein